MGLRVGDKVCVPIRWLSDGSLCYTLYGMVSDPVDDRSTPPTVRITLDHAEYPDGSSSKRIYGCSWYPVDRVQLIESIDKRCPVPFGWEHT